MKGEIYNFILHSDIGTGTSVVQLRPLLMLCYILMNWDAVIILLV